MSDRLLVIREGKIIGRHDRGEATAEELMAEMFGLSSTTQKREDLSK